MPWGRRVAPQSLAGAAVQGAVEGAGGVGGRGGVLRHIGGHRLIAEFGVSAEGRDLAYVELFAPGEFAFPDRVRRDRDVDPCGGGAYGVGEHGDGGVRRRGLAAAVGAVEWDDGVEVDQATLLVLGDLGEGDPEDRAGGLLGHPEPGGKLAAQVGGEVGLQG
ncbi:hypothetical protein TPA0910_41480 [Streptomyces hygroscopicus subsp. sporocinereus]|uniref:Uncharacterized protein n=1 Tax=Streptomyces hygroscopicus TaxID=1912 RepID=A0ABQ3U288_STRHY|nr:hypothetical protein TPA0910_41480 [Streptomyces hygroscopicus]